MDGDQKLNRSIGHLPATSRRRKTLALPATLALLAGAAWLRQTARGVTAEPDVENPAAIAPRARPLLPYLPTAAEPPRAKPASPLEYMSDGVPLMPPGPDDPHPDTFAHPHPITPQHVRIFRENALLFQLNEAMDGKEAPRLRTLLREYRDEYPEDPHAMQSGYALIADCLERPSEQSRAAAQTYWDEEIASTLRRFVRRHCLESVP